jgi:hypothetical protein
MSRTSGTPVSGALWVVYFHHQPLEAQEGAGVVSGHCHVITADPTGRELYEVSEQAVLGDKARPELEFTIDRVERGHALIRGTAQLAEERH